MISDTIAKEPLVFDDDSLDGILYGENPTTPTLADCFLPIKEHMGNIREAFKANDHAALLTTLTVITEKKMPLHQYVCDEIIEYTKILIPSIPLPELSYNIGVLTPLLEQIWTLPDLDINNERRVSIGDRLYRCYEHQKNFSAAQDVLHSLIKLSQDRGDKVNEAVYTNNLAFEYILEEQYEDAMTLFQYAQSIFLDENIDFQSANSRTNYLICMYKLGGASILLEHEEELKLLVQSLSNEGEWHVRKPYALLAEARASQNDLSGAIKYILKAIKASENYQVKWTEIDKKRLAELEAMKHNNPYPPI